MDNEKVPECPPAFPFAAEYGHPAAHGGMTLRDWFAGQAIPVVKGSGSPREHAFWAYEMADAMLAARKEDSHAG
ncbi:MAG: hypothetical protein GOVbin7759_22 [Prokaryotic dsDNA virus sp.]|jgi:hypothetical protein|nr:MAG: hypothetical protein GOVbin7759_22 [Prokaryotic dsDNA virus sp.]|tara:strand:- start:153 stop:374 length:222 start_codon:yes stop_codon:yes gene_type:complete